mgnify:CR=1 FL=1
MKHELQEIVAVVNNKGRKSDSYNSSFKTIIEYGINGLF